MGKNYVENSLKHFLKRKMKITLGFVVAFMITGAISFAATNEEKEQAHEEKVENMEIAKEFLTGLGTGVISANGNETYVTVDKTEENTIIKDKQGNTLVTVENSNISTKVADIISKTLENMNGNTDETGNIEIDGTTISNVTINRGIRESQQSIGEGGIISNNGIIKFDDSNRAAQAITGIGGTAYNFGIILNSGINGQYGAKSQSTVYNYGIIANGGNNGQKVENGKAYNYGIIINSGEFGQLIGTGDIYNYGVIANKNKTGQQAVNGKAFNYGIIKNDGDIGQATNGSSEIYNYGIIENTGSSGQVLEVDSSQKTAYNYGLIANGGDYAIKNAVKKGIAYNYGVVKNKTGNIFDGKVDNYGIAILTEEEKQTVINLGTGTNNGIILGYDYKLLEGYKDDVKQFHSGETIENFAGESSFGEVSKGYVFNETVNIDNTQDKVIGTVVTDSSKLENGAVLKYNGNDLFLDNTVITGYFEESGTLLNIETGNLTLKGDTVITAVKNDLSMEDVYAVKLSVDAKVTIIGDAQINGIINGGTLNFVDSKGTFIIDNNEKVTLGISNDTTGLESDYQKSFNVVLKSTGKDDNGQDVTDSVGVIEISTENAVKGLGNKLVLEDSVSVGKNAEGNSIYDTNKTNKDAELEITVNNIHKLEGNVSLGVGKDTFILKNNDNHESHVEKKIDLGGGEEDKFVVVGNATDDKGEAITNVFNYNVVNAETIELSGGTWGNWGAGKISFTDDTGKPIQTGKQPNFILGKGTTMAITLNATGEHGSDFENYIGKIGEGLGVSDTVVIKGTDETSKVKYLIDEKGLDSAKMSSDKYRFDDKVNYENNSAIFNVKNSKNGVTVTIKTAEEMGLSGEDRIIYHAYLNQIKAGNANAQVIGQINSYNSSEEFAKLIRQTSVTGEAYYTAGSTLTKDITNSYLSSVEDFTKRAGKGEWLAQGKYINSDTEFDGGKSVKGYDGDITGTVGMIEYGVTENTSYGAVFGMGDAEMNIQGGGKLDGDNTYFGAYMKHRTQNGIELVGNIGYMKSEMDSVLRNDFNFSNNTADEKHPVNTNGKTFEDGTANSSAVVIGLKGRKDYRISDSVKLQPTLGARLTFINQEEAENPEMHFTIVEQDIIVVEGTAGMGIAKEFALSEGKFELNTGFEYTFAAANSNNDARYKVFDEEHPLEDVEAAENTGKIYFGADYEHENGVGFNGKYEMMWSDKGDDSRITAGVSYRF